MPRFLGVPYLLAGGFYRLAWTEFGDPMAPPVICVHGLTRNGRDFDPLAQALAGDHRVICVDLPGRGQSDWLPDPALYQPLSYVQAMSHLLAAVGGPVKWVGTSLGGIVGMLIAAMPGQPVARMVLNDVGPFISREALRRIRDYMGKSLEFVDMTALEMHLRVIHRPFGDLSDAQWTHLAQHSAKVLPNGHFTMSYDPAIAQPIRDAEPNDLDLWAVWDRVPIPTMVVRGEDSDVLDRTTLARMEASGAKSLTVAEAGHAPALMDAPTIGAVKAFLG